jgi:hypothetical protein
MGLAIVLVLLLSGIASASSPWPDAGLKPASLAGADDGSLDVGAEFPSADAPPWGAGGLDLPYTADSAWHFYNKMQAAGYTGSDSFIYGNSSAWETDWKRAALGGSENSWVDNVDIMFFHDHGGNSYMWFPWGHTDDNLVPNDCAGSWGDKDVEWIGIKSCLTLIDRTGWATCMNGVHVIAGMITISYGADYGGDWADQLLGWSLLGMWLRSPKTITQAWFTTCDADQPSGVIARVIAEHPDHFNDKVWNRGGPAHGDDVDSWYHWIDHSCYKPAPSAVDISVLATVPAYAVVPRHVDQAYAASLASTLNMTGTLQLSADGQEYAVTNTENGMTRTLSIPTATGGYVYQDTSQLWVPPQPGQPLNLPGPQEAAALANAFFLANAEALPGIQNRNSNSQHIETDNMTTIGKAGTAAAASGVVEQTGVDVMVAYGRKLATTAVTAAGRSVAADVSVAGPGGSTKLYFGGQSGAYAAGTLAGFPVGLSGGSRDVQAGNPVTLKDVNTTWDAFVADPGLAVVTIPVDYTQMVRDPALDTFAYYEQPLNVPQRELIPTWVYTVDFMKDQQVVLDNALVYVPASADYYPPAVTIDSPQANATIVAGREVALNATVSSGNGPFTYEWAASGQGVLGTNEDITAMLLNKTKAGEPPSPVTLSLKVTDANGLSRAAEVTVTVVGQPVWLPLVIRHH